MPDRFEPQALFALILNLAALWATMSPDVLAVVDITDPDQRRKIVRDATARLLADQRPTRQSRPAGAVALTHNHEPLDVWTTRRS